MLVEFIGCTGSGKTTLIKVVQARLAKTERVTTATDLITRKLGLQSVKNLTAQNFIQELVGFPYFVRSYPLYRSFLAYTTQLLSRNTSSSITSFNNLRSLERKIGVYEILRGYPHNWIILVDEGPVLATHMFAFRECPLAAEEIAHFASLLPLPDILVYVKAPVDTLVQRTLERADPPRELGARNRVQIESAVRGTEFLFDQLVKAENIRSRILIVENSDLHTQDVAVDCIIEFIHKNQMAKS